MGKYKKLRYIFALFIALLLVGCGNVNFVQKIYPDWTFDLSVKVKSDNEFFLNTARSSLEGSPYFEKATLVELDDGFTYNLEKISLEETTVSEQGAVYESIGIKKEFKFPYYYYTITLKNKGLDDNEFGSFGMSLDYVLEPFGRIIDTNGVYVGDDKKAVKFNLLKEKEYYVTFKHFLISSILSGSNKIIEREAKETSFSKESNLSLGEESDNVPLTKNEQIDLEAIGNYHKNTINGITLIVDDYSFSKSTDDFGKLKDITFFLENKQGSDSIFPSLLITVEDSEDSRFTVSKEVSLSEDVDNGEIVKLTVATDIGVGALSNPKELKVSVMEWYTPLVSVDFPVDFNENPKLD